MRNEQFKADNNLKNEMPPNAMLLHVVYAESYENKQQNKCQPAHFGHATFSLFTAAVYIRHEESFINEKFAIVSEAKDNSRIVVHTCINKAIELMIEKHCHLKNFHNLDLHIWSDGCSAQFRSKYAFALTSLFPSSSIVTDIIMKETMEKVA